MIAVIVALIISILLESSVTTLPLTLSVILFAAVILRRSEIFLLAFLSGMILDALTFRPIGWSSLLFVILVFAVYLYENKFELETTHFIFFTSFLASFIYVFIMGLPFKILSAVLICAITSVSFLVFSSLNKKPLKYA